MSETNPAQVIDKEAASSRTPDDLAITTLTQKKLLAGLEASLAQLELDRAKLEHERTHLARPWWRSWNVTAIGAFLAAIAPSTVGIQGCWEKQKQVALDAQQKQHDLQMARQKQDEEIYNRYLDRMKDPTERQRTLRFLATTAMNPAIRDWAEIERSMVETERAVIEKKIEEQLNDAKEADSARQELLEKSRDAPALIRFFDEKAKQSRARAEKFEKDNAAPAAL